MKYPRENFLRTPLAAQNLPQGHIWPAGRGLNIAGLYIAIETWSMLGDIQKPLCTTLYERLGQR